MAKRFPLKISLFIALLFPVSAAVSQHIIKNDYVVYDVTQDGSKYIVNYIFKDHFDNKLEFRLELQKEQTDMMMEKFGVPKSIFSKHLETSETRKRNEQILRQGLFGLYNNTVEADKSAAIDYYAATFCKPVAEQIVNELQKRGKDTRRNRIELAMRFVQDIPYGAPKCNDKSKFCGGINPPPKLLVEGYGDCDSKAILFAGIMIYLIDYNDIIFLIQKKHILTAIKTGEKEKSKTYVRFHGKNYIIAETAGPGKRLLGQKGKYFSRSFRVETLKIKPAKAIPYN